MSERSFYKVKLGTASTGGQFIWTNNGRAIECDLACSIIPVTKSAAFALSNPPGYTVGTFHQKFEPSLSGTPSVTAISNTPFNKYNYSGCSLGGNEFLLTDHTLGRYCVTMECAMILLSRMFFIDNGYDGSKLYSGNGNDFAYGCDPYVECMYKNGVIYNIEPNENTGVVAFRLHVFGVTDPGEVGTIDFNHAYCLVEKDVVPGGYYGTSSKGHIYSYFLQQFNIDIIENLVSDPALLNAVDDPVPELVTIPSENLDASLNYSFGKRENIIHASGSADPIYGEVFSNSVTEGTWSNSAYYIPCSVSSRVVTPIQVGAKKDLTLFSVPNKANVNAGSELLKYQVYAWETITGKASSFTADDDYNKVTLTFSAVVGTGYKMRLMRDGKTLREFDPGTYVDTEYVDWTMGRGKTYHYSLVYHKWDHFGENYGEEVICTGSDLAYSDSDIPAITEFTYDRQFYTGVKYMWNVPTPGTGLEVAGYVYAVKMTDENGHQRFSDVIEEVETANGVASLFRVVKRNEVRSLEEERCLAMGQYSVKLIVNGSSSSSSSSSGSASDDDMHRCIFVKYRNTSNGKVIYSAASPVFPEVYPALAFPKRLISRLTLGKQTGMFLVKWKANYPEDTVFEIYYNGKFVETVSGTDNEFLYTIPFSNPDTHDYNNIIRVHAIFEINEYGETRTLVENLSGSINKETPPPSPPSPAPDPEPTQKEPDPTPYKEVTQKTITKKTVTATTTTSNPPAEKQQEEEKKKKYERMLFED